MIRAAVTLGVLLSVGLMANESEIAMNWNQRRGIKEQTVCCPNPSRKWETRVDFLYWQADEDGLEYGTKMEATPIVGTVSSTTTKLLDLDFEWDPGVLLGFSYQIHDFDSWNLDVNWTHIHNHAHGKSTAQGIEGQTTPVDTIIPYWVNLLFQLRFGASRASAHWDLYYNAFDFELKKSICLSDRFLFNPHFGVRGAWIHQDYKARYDMVFLLEAGTPPFTRTVTFIGENDFNGGGLRGGAELVCRIHTHWQLFAQLSANVLYGKFNVHMKDLNDQSLGEGGVPPSPMDFRAGEDFWRVRYNFEESIGIGWDRFFDCEKYRLFLRAAFDLSQWLNQNELFATLYFRGQDTISLIPVRSQGDLSFMGIRISAQFDF